MMKPIQAYQSAFRNCSSQYWIWSSNPFLLQLSKGIDLTDSISAVHYLLTDFYSLWRYPFMTSIVKIIGGGLAGSEAAWQLAERGFQVQLFEMPSPTKPLERMSQTVYPNLYAATQWGQNLLIALRVYCNMSWNFSNHCLSKCAEIYLCPCGWSISRRSRCLRDFGNFEKLRLILISVSFVKKITKYPDGPTIIATGPLTAPTLATAIAQLAGQEYLYFYDAIAPIVNCRKYRHDNCL